MDLLPLKELLLISTLVRGKTSIITSEEAITKYHKTVNKKKL